MRVLHVVYAAPPAPAGGTEIYARTLATALRKIGIESEIAAPSETTWRIESPDGVTYGFARGRWQGFASAYGEPDSEACAAFRDVLAQSRPEIVHLHARSAAVSELLFDVVRDAGARIVFTYHTPSVSCPRGTMMHRGYCPCDGALDATRCTACVLYQHGMPAGLDSLLAQTPETVGRVLGRAGLHGGPLTALRMRALISECHRGFHRMMGKADRVVAVCDWVAEVLRRNGLAEPKLVVSRQGLPYRPHNKDVYERPETGPSRIRYFGRLDPTKGVDLLIRAVRRARGGNAVLDIFGVAQAGSEGYLRQLKSLAAADRCVTFHDALPAEAVVPAMRRCDLVAVPSQWLETGPLVVLEAFAAGTPVLGSRLGGIAELVHDGIDGVLLPPHDVGAWVGAIERLAEHRPRVRALQAGIRPPRTVDAVAQDMAQLYEELLEPCN